MIAHTEETEILEAEIEIIEPKNKDKMALQDSVNLVEQSPSFQGRVKAAVVTSAIAILGELKNNFSKVQTEKRQTLAAQILSGGVNWSLWFYAIATNPTVATAGEAVDDGAIQFTVNSVWDKMAGVTTLDAVMEEVEPE